LRADYNVLNLVTDDSSVHPAPVVDPDLKNAWGIAFNPAGPAWISDNATGVTTVYGVTANSASKIGLTVTLPGDGSVTGQVYNSTTAFNSDVFLFVNEDGTISGWRGSLGTAAETLQIASANNVYKGSALATIGANTYLYAANFHAGTIDVLKGSSGSPNLTGTFTDPNLPSGYAPFNIQMLSGKLYVTYALQDATKHDDVAGAGLGFVDAFDLQGNLLNRVASQGTLNSPWGLAIAPSTFGSFAGDLLVGNFGDGKINVFNISTDAYMGQLSNAGQPISIDGLWALSVGTGTNASSLYFTAGPDGETHGLFGAIVPVPEPSSIILLASGIIGFYALTRKRATGMAARQGTYEK
jgi:uncharacterized protein (TIGR03118 family)